MADKETTDIVTRSGTVRIEQPKNSDKNHTKVSVIVAPEQAVGGFLDFLREHAIIGLAIGLVIGTQVKNLVDQIVSSFFDPLFTLLFGGQALRTRTFTVHFSGRNAPFGWGAVVYTMIDFVFVLLALYILIKLFKLEKPTKKDDSAVQAADTIIKSS